ncbi:type VI secretion system Vgr family protein [Enterobacter mori]|uniref:type VI secretion system Vgr family protein n=1 Tax=Enterobacter mori TaxID=539813 RepID=UPI003B83FDFE
MLSNISFQEHFLSWNGSIAEELELISLKGEESLSSPYLYEVRSRIRHRLNEEQLSRWHGEPVSCRIGNGRNGTPVRFLHGVVTKIHHVQHVQDESECILTLEPALALLRMGQNTRVWQKIQVPDLIRKLLKESGIALVDVQVHNRYPEREYCIQYRESDFDFIHRLLEEEGIYYFFSHSSSGHTLVLADHPASHPSVRGNSLSWSHHGLPDCIESWGSSVSLVPGAVSVQGFSMPQAMEISERLTAGTKHASAERIKYYDISPKGERSQLSRQASVTMTSCETNSHLYHASVNAYWLGCGEVFMFTDHPSGKKKYRIHSLVLEATKNMADFGAGNSQSRFQAMTHDITWVPPVKHLPPEIPGVLTAMVVGPASEDIHTDEFGRIKIQFPWDNINDSDDTSSCWVRVTQPWSGGKFGGQFIPRVGSEVVVSFVQGHPDHPLVTGTVYNGQNKPPFNLPENKNESGFVTRSTAKGSVEEGHRLSFNDKKGHEKLTIIAQKDLSLTVKNEALYEIATNRSTELRKGNDRLVLKEGNMSVALEKGDWQQRVVGNVTTELENGDYALQVKGGKGDITTDKILTLESSQSIEFRVGDTTLTLSKDGITLSSSMIDMTSSKNATLSGANIEIKGNQAVALKGKTVDVEGSSAANVSGKNVVVSGGLIKIG